jgi:hypothetical protein
VEHISSHLDNNRSRTRAKQSFDNRTRTRLPYKQQLAKAEQLAERLNDPDGVGFYFKVVGELEARTINRLVDLALERGTVPGAYFNRLAREEMNGD